jgi:hypothetical protein
MRLRGLSGARDEFHLAAIVQNLKTLALRGLGPPSSHDPANRAQDELHFQSSSGLCAPRHRRPPVICSNAKTSSLSSFACLRRAIIGGGRDRIRAAIAAPRRQLGRRAPMRKVVRIVAKALAATLSLIAAMPLVAGWGRPAGPITAPVSTYPLELMASHGFADPAIEDFSTIY